jgi:hypothetical protein
MATRISDTEMSSDVTRHTARMWPAPADACGVSLWSVSWLPGRLLTQNQAVTAMTIAEVVAVHEFKPVGAELGDVDPVWLHIDQWAAELGITGPHAVAEASLPPEEHQERHDAERDAEDDEDDEDGAVWAAPADGRGNGLLDLTHPERLGLINVMTGHERSVLLAYIAGYAPEVFDHALAQRPEAFPAELARRAEAKAEAEYMADPEGYCIACGENVAWFMGHDGPQHFRGPHKLVTGAERRELFAPDDGHAPQVAWRQPDTTQDGGRAGGNR